MGLRKTLTATGAGKRVIAAARRWAHSTTDETLVDAHTALMAAVCALDAIRPSQDAADRIIAGLSRAAQIPHEPVSLDETENAVPADDVRSVSWAIDSAFAEDTGDPPLPWSEIDDEDRERFRLITASLRDAGWVRVKPHEDAVEALLPEILAECVCRGFVTTSNAAVVAIRAVYAAIGGRELALEKAAWMAAAPGYYSSITPIEVRDAAGRALALPPTAAAEAVRGLVAKARAVYNALTVPDLCIDITGPEANHLADMLRELRAALAPFRGDADA